MSTAARQTISTPNVSNNTAIRVRMWSPIRVRPRNARASESIHPRAMSLSVKVKGLIFPREGGDAPDEDEFDDSPGEDEFEDAPDECEFEDPPDEDDCEDSSSSGGSLDDTEDTSIKDSSSTIFLIVLLTACSIPSAATNSGFVGARIGKEHSSPKCPLISSSKWRDAVPEWGHLPGAGEPTPVTLEERQKV